MNQSLCRVKKDLDQNMSLMLIDKLVLKVTKNGRGLSYFLLAGVA